MPRPDWLELNRQLDWSLSNALRMTDNFLKGTNMPGHETDAWFTELPEDQKPVLAKLRKLILAAGPGVVEELKWGRPCYSTAKGLFCYLHSTKNYATLGFHKGTALKDPKKLLEGTGKDMRHIKIKTAKDLDEPAVKALLKQAVALGS